MVEKPEPLFVNCWGLHVDNLNYKLHRDPDIEEFLQFYEIYLGELKWVFTVNTREKYSRFQQGERERYHFETCQGHSS